MEKIDREKVIAGVALLAFLFSLLQDGGSAVSFSLRQGARLEGSLDLGAENFYWSYRPAGKSMDVVAVPKTGRLENPAKGFSIRCRKNLKEPFPEGIRERQIKALGDLEETWNRFVQRPDLAFRDCSSSLSRYDNFLLAREMLQIDPSRRRYALFPLKPLRRGFAVDEPAREALWRDIEEPGASEGAGPVAEVLNSSLKPGKALEVTRELRQKGIDVVYYGNASVLSRQTWVLDRRGRQAPARQVQQALGKRAKFLTEVDLNRQVDATVILGEDY